MAFWGRAGTGYLHHRQYVNICKTANCQDANLQPSVASNKGKVQKKNFYRGLGHTALKCKYYHYQWYSCLMEGKGSKKVREGGLGCYQPLVTKMPP